MSEAGVLLNIASDHCVIYASLEHKISTLHSYKHLVWDYKRENYDASRQLLHNALAIHVIIVMILSLL